MPRKWITRDETILPWKTFPYTHLNEDALNAIENATVSTSDRCRDPGKLVIDRHLLCAIINERLVSLGYSMETHEVDFRTLAQYCFKFSTRKGVSRDITISSPSRARYILVGNGSAALIADFVISNIDEIDVFRDKAVETQMKGRRAALRGAKSNA